jgi:PTS system nitrogen regulatory IIA component
MASIAQLIANGRVLHAADVTSKKRIFELAAQKLAETTTLDEEQLYVELLAREKLGSTGLGNGVAIPHCRLTGCETPVGLLMTLMHATDFDAPDNRPVDIVFVLIVPEEATQEHLDILALLVARFASPDYCQSLRDAADATALRNHALSTTGP